jgi:hypothetical protein
VKIPDAKDNEKAQKSESEGENKTEDAANASTETKPAPQKTEPMKRGKKDDPKKRQMIVVQGRSGDSDTSDYQPELPDHGEPFHDQTLPSAAVYDPPPGTPTACQESSINPALPEQKPSGTAASDPKHSRKPTKINSKDEEERKKAKKDADLAKWEKVAFLSL